MRTLLLLLVALAPVATAQVCPGDVVLTSPAAVAAFDCERVGGLLAIADAEGEPPIRDLAGLSELVSVDGHLIIQNTSELASLGGLDSLARVGGLALVEDNAALASVVGLGALERVGSTLTFGRNPALVELDGLAALRETGWGISIKGNASLERIGGFDALTAVGTASIAVATIEIQGNGALREVAGFGALAEIGQLAVWDNERLERLGGFPVLGRATGGVYVASNEMLAEMPALSALAEVAPNDFGGGGLTVARNPALTSLNDLSSLESLIGLAVFENASLSACGCGLYDLLASGGVRDDVYIAENAPGCNAPSDIPEPAPGTCSAPTASDDDPRGSGLALSVGPNPVLDQGIVRFTRDAPGAVRLTVVDLLGRTVVQLWEGVAAGDVAVPLDVSLWPPGVYGVRLATEEALRTAVFTVAR